MTQVSLTLHILLMVLVQLFSDQKTADQFAVRRMFRWYMPIYRQFIEWTILNTGVIVRERPNGKRKWSGVLVV